MTILITLTNQSVILKD